MHVLPNGQRSGCSKAGWSRSTHCTLHSAHNTSTPEHSMPLGFYPGLNHSDRTTTFLYSLCRLPRLCSAGCRPSGRQASAPSGHAVMPLGIWLPSSLSAQATQTPVTHTDRAMSKRKRVFIRFCLHAPASSYCVRDDTICMATCHSYHKLVLLAR